MALAIAQLGQPVLRQVAAPVSSEEIGSSTFQSFLQSMRETLQEARGAGLAAPQVSVSKRVFLGAVFPPESEKDPPGVEVFVNPRLTPLTTDKVNGWEGCLSFPELLVLVPRLLAVRIDYIDQQGRPCALELEGFPARIVQHEFDHLEGVLTLDRAASTHHIIKASEIDAVHKEMDEE
jgi:peptide deformylase